LLGLTAVSGAAVVLAQQPVVDTVTTQEGVTLDLASAATDVNQLYADGCQQGVAKAELIICEYGDPDSETTVFLVGGSHASHWFPALERIGEDQGWRILTATKGSCRFSADGYAEGVVGRTCSEWNRDAMAAIVAESPDLVLTTSTVAGTAGMPEAVPEGYIARWRELASQSIPVAAIRDVPMSRINRVECLHNNGPDSAECDVPRDQSLLPEDPAAQLEGLPPTVFPIDMTDSFCDASTCPAIMNGMVVYVDSQHLSKTYSQSLAPELGDRLRSVAGDLF
jgi:hypothetical protein